MQVITSTPPLPLDAPQWARFRQREQLRKAMLEGRFDEVERTMAALEAAWWQSTGATDDHYTFLDRKSVV